jgi:hypothetical protein
MYIYHLWIKEYTNVWWTGFLILFIISSLPIVIKKFRDQYVFYHQAYNVFFNFIIASQFSGTGQGTGNDIFAIAFFIAFGIGYSILFFRKENKDSIDKILSIFSFIFYMCIFIRIISSQINRF